MRLLACILGSSDMNYIPQSTIDAIVELAKEVEKGDNIDFGYLSVSEDDAYRVCALGLLEKHLGLAEEDREIMLLAVCTHLIVENMVLNLKLLQRG